LRITLVGIALATIPLIGGWGSANWMIPWADEAGQAASPPDPYLKARVGQARAVTGAFRRRLRPDRQGDQFNLRFGAADHLAGARHQPKAT
jgi:hypothetical protein